jgi:glyoxylase-like metal-dependent hydrolase (beta-lactamase superfamily II)
MLHLDRRTLLTTATAAAVFGLTKPLEIIPSAHAQGTGASAMNPTAMKFKKFKIGDIEVTTIFEGAIERDHNPGMVKNASIDDVKAALAKLKLPNEKNPNAYTVTVIKNGAKTIMFDAGNGPGGAPGTNLLAENLTAAGIDPASITNIVITHFHPDHIYGLMAKDNTQLFGNAEIMVPEAEYKYWADPAVIEKLPEARRGIAVRVQASMPTWKNLKQIAADVEVLPGVRSVPSYGHSPGHTSFHVTSGKDQMMVLADVTNTPAINLQNPGWHVMFDQDAAMAEAIRRKLLDRAVAEKMICTGYHWGMPGAGTIAQDGAGYVLVPVT